MAIKEKAEVQEKSWGGVLPQRLTFPGTPSKGMWGGRPHMQEKGTDWVWRDGSTVTNTGNSARGPGLDSQQTREPPVVCNSSFKGSKVLFWHPQVPGRLAIGADRCAGETPETWVCLQARLVASDLVFGLKIPHLGPAVS